MILRPYQETAVTKAQAALKKHGDTVVVAPTGSGKTILLSDLIRRMKPKKALIIQHRDELVSQNLAKYMTINKGRIATAVNAYQKNWTGDAVFAMVQTLCRPKTIDGMPPIDLAVVDECHHVVADSYLKVIDRIKEVNPKAMIAGFTATPTRGDKKGLRKVFSNVAYSIGIKDLIDMGFLVKPKAFVIDVGKQEELSKVKKTATDYDMSDVAKIMNTYAVNQEVVRQWRARAAGRRTVVFCSTVDHAGAVVDEFKAAGIRADMVTGETPSGLRARMLQQLKRGEIDVMVNVAVLTEGFDEPSVSCVVLLRPCSYKTTMIQMIGRGLRTVSERDYPGMVKTDCIVLDFGISLLTHGDIDADTRIHDEAISEKYCPKTDGGCGVMVPGNVYECPLCGYIFREIEDLDEQDIDDTSGQSDSEGRLPLFSVTMTELEILKASPFRWVDLFGTGKVMVASGFSCFAAVASKCGDTWVAMGKKKDSRVVEKLYAGEKPQAMSAADDFMRCEEESVSAKKAARWMSDNATERQGQLLEKAGYRVDRESGVLGGITNFTKLTATAHLNFTWNRYQIERALGVR